MHAFLIVGNSDGHELALKLNAKLIEFSLQKIDDVRAINHFLRLSIDTKTLLLLRNVDLATNESLNAFLKNLEEPQENVFFALTCNNIKAVLPTIVSRCQIVKLPITNYQFSNKSNAEEFLNKKTKEQLEMIEKIKDRQEAINFINDLIYLCHQNKSYIYQEIFLNTLKNLKANGNIALQLASLVVRMGNANG